MREILESYEAKKREIRNRLEQFRAISPDERKKEFVFCLLTPQSQAKKCWEAVREIFLLENLTLESLTKILSTKTRFHYTKATRVLENLEKWCEVEAKLNKKDVRELRFWLAKNVKGYGLKESAHFLRNIGRSENKIAILDRHILKNLRSIGIISGVKIFSQRDYIEIEKKFLDFADALGIPADELDLLWWGKENGEIFK